MAKYVPLTNTAGNRVVANPLQVLHVTPYNGSATECLLQFEGNNILVVKGSIQEVAGALDKGMGY